MSDDIFTASNAGQTPGMTTQGQNIPDEYKKQSTSTWQDVRQLNVYNFMEATYDGSEGYRNGSYLIPHPKEGFYVTRCNHSYYIPIYKAILDAMIDPVFNQSITRTTSNDKYLGFIANCDSAGTPLQDMINSSILHGRNYGVNFVVVDNYPTMEGITEQQVIDNRRYPYIYEKSPSEIHKYLTDQWGKLTSITFCDIEQEYVADGKNLSRQLYREWTAQSWRLYYETKSKDGQVTELTVEEGTHGLGVIPVIPILDFVKSKSLKTLPVPPLYNLAFLSFALFNKESLVQTLELYQSFSMLVTSGFDVNSLIGGPTSFLNCGADAKFPPSYISPNVDNTRVLVENCQRLVDLIYKTAAQDGVIGVQSAQSGVSKEWDFRSKESVCRLTSTASKNLELAIANLFGRYINQPIDLVVEYPMEFSPQRDNDRLTNALNIIKEMPPQPVAEVAWEEVMKVFLKHDPARTQEIVDKLKSDLEDKQNQTNLMNEISSMTEKPTGEVIPNE